MAENDGPPLGKFLASSGWLLSSTHAVCAHFSEEKATRDKAVKHLVQFLSQPSGRVLSDDLELAKLWKGIFYCALPLIIPGLPAKVLIVTRKKATGCPISLSSSRPWQQNSRTSFSGSLTPPPPSSFSKAFGIPLFVNGMASIVSGMDRCRLGYSSSLSHPAQDGQVLYAHSTFRQRLLHPPDKK